MFYANLKSSLTTWNLTNAPVFLRADLNVPLEHGVMQDDFKLRMLLPTLDYLLTQNCIITIGTHLGQPDGYDPKLSVTPLRAWLSKHGYTKNITLLENLRFEPGETACSMAYAQELAKNIDYYVDDAFGSLHRSSASLTLLPQLFDAAQRTIGFLVERELAALQKLLEQPKENFILVVGGGKAADKLKFVEAMLPKIGHLLPCPALTQYISQEFLEKAAQLGVQVHMPVDYRELSVGPATIKAWQPVIAQATTIFFNGPMGNLEVPETTRELEVLLRLIAACPAYKVAGGSSTHEALVNFGLADRFDFCSTGGGATLAYLSGKQLPALDALR